MDITKLATPSRGPVKNRSAYDTWLETLGTDEQAAVLKAIKDKAWGHVALLDVLVSEGAPKLSATNFQQWRHKMGLPR